MCCRSHLGTYFSPLSCRNEQATWGWSDRKKRTASKLTSLLRPLKQAGYTALVAGAKQRLFLPLSSGFPPLWVKFKFSYEFKTLLLERGCLLHHKGRATCRCKAWVPPHEHSAQSAAAFIPGSTSQVKRCFGSLRLHLAAKSRNQPPDGGWLLFSDKRRKRRHAVIT